MKGFIVFVFVCLVAVGEASHEVEMEVDFCEDDQCGCPEPRQATVDNTEYMDDLGCHCACGSSKNEECVSDGDCIFGLHCAAGSQIGGRGECKDACQKPNFSCSIFDSCHIVEDTGEPECVCKIRPCSDMRIGHGVCARDLEDQRALTFDNDCLMVNADCERRNAGRLGYEKLQLEDCSEVIENGQLHRQAINSFGIFK